MNFYDTVAAVTHTAHKQQLLENITRLRRAEHRLPGNMDLLAVRTDLERELGPTVTRSMAAQFLGLSHTALNRWAKSGDLPLVFTPEGRTEVPISALVPLYEAVRNERRSGRRHALEPVFTQGRERAERLDPERLVASELRVLNGTGAPDRHRIAQLRSLAYHRALAKRLRKPMVDDARGLIWQWRQTDKIDARYAQAWDEILSLPLSQIRNAIGEDIPGARDLRQNSPFVGQLSEPERHKIIASIG